MKIIQEIKKEYAKNKLQTAFFTLALLISVLSFLKPSYTKSIWGHLSITSINLAVIGFLLFVFWYSYWRKK